MRLTNTNREKLSLKRLRIIEQDLGVYLSGPKDTRRTNSQQFGVYDEDEHWAGDVVANNVDFDEDELREKIRRLFP